MAKSIDRVKARNCAFLNLLATPGLGSLMGGRIAQGAGQLLLAVAGFCLVVYWFVKVLNGAFSAQDTESHSYAVWGFTGGMLFILAWFWSLVTSLALLREAKKDATPKTPIEPPHIQAIVAMRKLGETEIDASLTGLPEWKKRDDCITRTFVFQDFPAAIRFVNAVAAHAEEAWHHPDIDVRWNKVTLVLTTHDAGGLTEKDFALAKMFDGLT